MDGGVAGRGSEVGAPDAHFLGEVYPEQSAVRAIPARESAPPPNVVTIEPGTRMEEVERRVIEAALKESRGNRRRAAEMLGIGERTLYRKIKEYRVPEEMYAEH
jgi:DNA-binding NtrC family response regulator